jgi:Tol biopolymer transport system component
MIDERELREMLERRARTISATPTDAPKAIRRARRRLALNAAVGTLVGLAVLAGAFAGFRTIQAVPTPADRPTPSVTPTPSGTVLRRDGEVITSDAGRLVAVDPDTGESRIIADSEQTQRRIGNAAWSPDGRWVAYDLQGSGLWVVNAEREPRQLAASYARWTWSPTAPQLAMVRDSRLTVVDASTGRQTDLGDVVGDVTSAPVWSPDGTRILYGVRGGSLYSVDLGSGDRSLLVRLPGDDLDSMDQIAWSPDGAYLAILNDLVEPGDGRLYVMNADGSGVRVLLDNFEPGGWFSWSPDGTRLAYAALSGLDVPELLIWTGSLDGSAPSLVASHSNDGCQLPNRSFTCDAGGSPVWSPDGSQIAFETARSSWLVRSTPTSPAFVINSDGTGDLRTIDQLTYLSWSDGSYHCECYG